MSNEKITKKFDLEERTAKLGEGVVRFAAKLMKNPVTLSIIGQLVRSATSVGANYCEADDAESGKDFQHKIGICKKEARETKHWLRMVSVALPEFSDEARILWQEAKELNLIFNAIIKSSRKG